MRAVAYFAGNLIRGSGSAVSNAAVSAPIGTRLPEATTAAYYHSSRCLCAGDPLGRGSMDGRVSGAADGTRQTGDTYYATPSYPNTNPDENASDDASAAAMAASRSSHPSGPADTSSVNDPAGRAEGGEALGRRASDHVHHPGRPDAVGGGPEAGQGRPDAVGGGPEAGQGRPDAGQVMAAGSEGGAGAGGERDLQGGDFDQAEGGKTGGIAGSWRAMTADFAAGGDDITGGGTAGTAQDDAALNASVNPDTGLPGMPDVDDAGAHASGFGQQRDPSAAREEGGDHEARFRPAGADTSELPGDLSSS